MTSANGRFLLWIAVLAAAVLLIGCAAPRYAPPPPAAPRSVRAVAAAPVVAPSIPVTQLPRVMILVDEKSLGTIPTAEVEALLARKMLERQIRVVDQDMVRAGIAREQQLLTLAGDARGAAAVGLQFGADVVIIGEAVAKPSARRIGDTNLRTYQAVATLRAIRTDNSSVLASASEDATQAALEDVTGSARVLREAGERAADTLVPAMLSGWVAAGATPGEGRFRHRLALTVGGIDQMWKLRAVREGLRGMDDSLRNVTQRSYTAGLAVFECESAVPGEELAELLVLQPPEGLRMQVLNIGPEKIELRAVAQ